MISPEYKVVNDSVFLPESGSGLKSKTRIKFIQEKDGVALYDGGAYIGQFISSTGDKITLDENKNVIIPGDSGSGLDLNKLKESDSIEIKKSTEDKTATFSVKENYLKSFINENASIVAKPDGGVVVEKLSDEKASSYELSLDDNYHIDEHSWEVDDPPKIIDGRHTCLFVAYFKYCSASFSICLVFTGISEVSVEIIRFLPG